MQVRVVELYTRWWGDIRCGNDAWALLAQVGDDRLVMLGRHGQVLDIKNQFGDVFLDAGYGRELVQYSVDSNTGDSCTGDRGQQGTA
jgi:hypothetical protein